MSINTNRMQYLLRQYTQKACTLEELQELFAFIAQPQNREQLETMMEAEYEVLQPLSVAEDVDWEYIFQQVTQKTDAGIIPLGSPGRFGWKWVAAAAAIVLALGLGGFWFMNRLTKQPVADNENPVQQPVGDVLPGGNKAVLTLANGTAIVLDSAQNGILSQQGNVSIIKKRNGEVAYKPVGGKDLAVTWNMLATPKGGQYQLVLPDGSKVWLNAASSIRYPVAFTGNERNVELTGEAYFEVAKNPAMPFKVIIPSSTKAGRSMIEVLGTHFNVSAYNDEEATKTTLLEGKVRIVSGEWAAGNGRSTGKKQEALLQPGQQAQLFTSGQLKKIDDADIELAMAWKNGFTAFKRADIKSIMRQVARWYNVEVVYEGTIPQRSFTGGISRDARLSELLHLLEVSKVNFRIEGNRLVVMA
ncbi:hypothetical protein A4D02_26050 [Niastella koreensis]|uniref:Anti-FecI sigma factor, FecR n=2 Tax=Niastella koreensis TaxID=354356 RepID=G8TM28_NIAKG|nr:FecR family protein [Niastella koreensis]AEV99801.1 anti-FecI sigma factor, FecR [Niastella koreensis GR20-10]OQP51579.1 hypothetical protein A4D02_26050 [Niastella koreensis]